MRGEIGWTMSCSHDFLAHIQRSQRWHFSQTTLQWFEVLSCLMLALPGLSVALVGALRYVVGAPPVLPGDLKLITITPMVHQHNVFYSLEDSRSVREDEECKLRCINCRRVSDPRRGFRPAFRVTGISDDCNRNTMGVSVIGLGTPLSTRENVGCTWEHLRVPAIRLGAPITTLEAPGSAGIKFMSASDKSGCAGDMSGCSGDKTGITSNHSLAAREKQLFWNAAGAPGNHSYYVSFNDC